MKRSNKLSIALAAGAFAVLAGTVLYAAQDKYALVSPGGIKFADFKG